MTGDPFEDVTRAAAAELRRAAAARSRRRRQVTPEGIAELRAAPPPAPGQLSLTDTLIGRTRALIERRP